MTAPALDRVMQLIAGAWAASILGAGTQYGIFTALQAHPDNAEGLAQRVGISNRGAQALLDGLTGLGLLTVSGTTNRTA
jgi:Dimerisation domain